jgi:hypothetical protein
MSKSANQDTKNEKENYMKKGGSKLSGVDSRYCYACEVTVAKGNREWHHFPVPQRCGGQYVVPLCLGCHDMIDRVPLREWSVNMAHRAITESNMNREGKLFLMKLMSRLWHLRDKYNEET